MWTNQKRGQWSENQSEARTGRHTHHQGADQTRICSRSRDSDWSHSWLGEVRLFEGSCLWICFIFMKFKVLREDYVWLLHLCIKSKCFCFLCHLILIRNTQTVSAKFLPKFWIHIFLLFVYDNLKARSPCCWWLVSALNTELLFQSHQPRLSCEDETKNSWSSWLSWHQPQPDQQQCSWQQRGWGEVIQEKELSSSRLLVKGEVIQFWLFNNFSFRSSQVLVMIKPSGSWKDLQDSQRWELPW